MTDPRASDRSVPPGYRSDRVGSAHVIAQDAALAFVHEAIAAAGTLYDYAAAHPEAETIAGRGRLHLIPGPGSGRWVVRRLTHGGMLAPLTGDRFLSHGRPRPFNELHLSVELTRLGVPTPRVVAAVVYRSGIVYRGEIAREEIAPAWDLASCLFGDPRQPEARRIAALAESGRLIAALHRAGVVHPDLNMRNVLITWRAGAARAHILDLEKCRKVRRLPERWRRRMIDRLRRSALRFEARTGRRITDAEWAAFSEGYHG